MRLFLLCVALCAATIANSAWAISASLTAPANGAVFMAPASITLSATATPTNANRPIVKVEFFRGTTLIGTDTNSPYSFNWTNVAAGTYSLTAKATDSTGATATSAARSIKVNAPPTVSLTSPAGNANFAPGSTIALAATASDTDGTITKVEFLRGTTLIGTDTTSPYSFNWTSVAAGSYALTARATDNNGAVTTSAVVNITVDAPPTVSITAPANNAIFIAPGSVTISANAADTGGSVAKVDFFQGTTLIGTDTTSPYSFAWTNVAAGSYALTARATDNQGVATTSAVVNIKVDAPPTVSITSPANNAVFPAPANVTVMASAADADGSVAKVDFFDGATQVGTATTSPYSVTLSNVAAGTHTYTARATDNNGAVTTSAAVSIIVNTPSTVSITAPAANAVFTAPASITVTATAADAGGSVAKVDFFDGATQVGTATTAPYSVSLTNVAAGTHVLTARATDNQGAVTTSAAVSIIVDAPPGVAITSPANNTVVTAPANITITATATDADGSVTKVDFFDGATQVGTATTAPYSVTLTNVAAGSHVLTARATDNQGAVTTSAAVTLIVNTPPTVAITAPVNNALFTAPASITVTATASDADGTVAKVDFFDGATQVGTATTSPYSVSLANVAAGTHVLTARATDNQGAVTASAAVSVLVDAPPGVAITSPANNAVLSAPATLAITATATDADGMVTKVDFYNGATLLGTATTAPYSFNWTNVAAGTYSLTAIATDNSGAATTSAPVTLIVNSLPAVSISSPAAGDAFTAPATISVTATATDADGTVTKVDFYDGASLVGTATASPYSATIANAAAGTHVLSAVATDNQGAVSTSAAVSVTVSAANQPPTVGISSPAGGATFTAPASITVTATAADADGSIAKVDFYQGATLITTLTGAPYTLQWTGVPAGSYSLTAVATDNQGAASTSAAVSVTVGAAQAGPAQMYYIHADHLNTPRRVYDQSQALVWSWDQQEPFGSTPPNDDPNNTGNHFDFPFRFAGQYCDKETGLCDNWYRTYFPELGRYGQFDPLGLRAGINGYLYVNASPLRSTDPEGLQIAPPGGGSIGGAAGGFGGLGGFGGQGAGGRSSNSTGNAELDKALGIPGSGAASSSSSSKSALDVCEEDCEEKKNARDALCFIAKARGGKAAQKLCLDESDRIWIQCLEKCKKNNCPTP